MISPTEQLKPFLFGPAVQLCERNLIEGWVYLLNSTLLSLALGAVSGLLKHSVTPQSPITAQCLPHEHSNWGMCRQFNLKAFIIHLIFPLVTSAIVSAHPKVNVWFISFWAFLSPPSDTAFFIQKWLNYFSSRLQIGHHSYFLKNVKVYSIINSCIMSNKFTNFWSLQSVVVLMCSVK